MWFITTRLVYMNPKPKMNKPPGCMNHGTLPMCIGQARQGSVTATGYWVSTVGQCCRLSSLNHHLPPMNLSYWWDFSSVKDSECCMKDVCSSKKGWRVKMYHALACEGTQRGMANTSLLPPIPETAALGVMSIVLSTCRETMHIEWNLCF